MAYPREEANQSWHLIYKTKYAYKIISMVYVVEVIFLIRDQLKRSTFSFQTFTVSLQKQLLINVTCKSLRHQ